MRPEWLETIPGGTRPNNNDEYSKKINMHHYRHEVLNSHNPVLLDLITSLNIKHNED